MSTKTPETGRYPGYPHEEPPFRTLMYSVVQTRNIFRNTLRRLLASRADGITFEMAQVMICLNEENGLSQREISERTSKSKACIASIMTNMERKGLVTRTEDPEDRRGRLVYMTGKGYGILGSLMPELDMMYITLERNLGPEKVKEMISCMKSACMHLNGYQETLPDREKE